MSKRLLLICQAEGLQVNETTLACLVEGTNGDIRAILGQLQMIRLRRSVLAYDDAKVQRPYSAQRWRCGHSPMRRCGGLLQALMPGHTDFYPGYG